MVRVAYSDGIVAAATQLHERFGDSDPVGKLANVLLNADPEKSGFNYLKFDDSLQFSYLPTGKGDDAPDKWNSTQRITVRPARVIRSLDPKCRDHEYETFLNRLRGQYIANAHQDRFRRVVGEEIRYWYSENSHAFDAYVSSCMTYKKCQKYLDIYTENPERISLLVYLSLDQKLLGRMLVWITRKGTTIYDRPYGKPYVLEALMAYAEAQGWRNAYRAKYTIPLDNIDFKYYPYMDNMMYLNRARKEVRNYGNAGDSEDSAAGYTYYLNGTEGDDHEGMDDCLDEDRDYMPNSCVVCDAVPFGNDQMYETPDGDHVCSQCIAKNLYFKCSMCRFAEEQSSTTMNDLGNPVCRDCTHDHNRCDICSTYTTNLAEAERGIVICANCIDKPKPTM